MTTRERMYALEAFDRSMICRQHIVTFLVILSLHYNGNTQVPCAACKSSPIDEIFYMRTLYPQSNDIRTQTDRTIHFEK